MEEGRNLTLSKLRDYIDEWVMSTMSLKMLIDGNPDAFHYMIVYEPSKEVVFSQDYKNSEFTDEENTMCSTTGIVNEDLRGLVEQAIDIDRELEAKRFSNPSAQMGQ